MNEYEGIVGKEQDNRDVAKLVGALLVGGTILGLSLTPSPKRFFENTKGYNYDMSGGVMAATFLLDTNRDGFADLRIHDGTTRMARFRTEREPSVEEQYLFRQNYVNYISSKGGN